jgi:hypothetical protein
MKPPKPVWWKVILGLILVFNSIYAVTNRKAPPPNANRDQVQGMEAAQAMMVFVGGWLVWSGTKPLRKPPGLGQ